MRGGRGGNDGGGGRANRSQRLAIGSSAHTSSFAASLSSAGASASAGGGAQHHQQQQAPALAAAQSSAAAAAAAAAADEKQQPTGLTLHGHWSDVAAAEPVIAHISALSFYVVDERPDAHTPARRAAFADPLNTTPVRQRGRGLPPPPPDVKTVLHVAQNSQRNLVSLGYELHMRSADLENVKSQSALHLDGNVRREQILGVYPEKFQIGSHRYYLARVVGEHYILDTYAHEQDIEERLDYRPPLLSDGTEPTRQQIPVNTSNFSITFKKGAVFNYCCLVTLDGKPLPAGKYRLRSALKPHAIPCSHPPSDLHLPADDAAEDIDTDLQDGDVHMSFASASAAALSASSKAQDVAHMDLSSAEGREFMDSLAAAEQQGLNSRASSKPSSSSSGVILDAATRAVQAEMLASLC